MKWLCVVFGHNWQGCCCERCGKLQDLNHAWEGCICSICGKIQHTWNGCICAICKDTRDIAHNYNELLVCRGCGARKTECCSVCNGSGEDSGRITCPTCDGWGGQANAHSPYGTTYNCPDCFDGTVSLKCIICNGTGRIKCTVDKETG